jgi:hypothetical protein
MLEPSPFPTELAAAPVVMVAAKRPKKSRELFIGKFYQEEDNKRKSKKLYIRFSAPRNSTKWGLLFYVDHRVEGASRMIVLAVGKLPSQ